jgi:light-independent protochlorophyllide reductase subunit B
MLERERDFTPVKTTLVDRHVLTKGSQTKVIENLERQYKEENPDFILLTPTCTSSILQEDLNLFVKRACQNIKTPILLADVNHYRINELQASDKTLEQVLSFILSVADEATQTSPQSITTLHDGKSTLVPRDVETQDAPLWEPTSTDAAATTDPMLRMKGAEQTSRRRRKTTKPSVNILGVTTLGFHHQHDTRELQRLLLDLGYEINEIIPEGSSLKSIQNLPSAWFNVVPYRECGLMAAEFLKKKFGMPYTSISPIGVLQTKEFILELESLRKQVSFSIQDDSFYNGANQVSKDVGCEGRVGEPILTDATYAMGDPTHVPNESMGTKLRSTPVASHPASLSSPSLKPTHCRSEFVHKYIHEQTSFLCQAAWFSRSIDCQNLTGKRAIVFGDSTHAAAFTKLLVRELGLKVVLAGTYCKNDSSWFREQVQGYSNEVLISEDYNQVSEMIEKLEPSAIFGTQMERHIGKRLGIPTAVISAPIHIQNFSLSYRPFLGYEGANYIADLVYNTYTLGMEEHLLSLFGGHDNVALPTTMEANAASNPSDSNLSDAATLRSTQLSEQSIQVGHHSVTSREHSSCTWTEEAKKELSFIPSFVRNKVKKRTEEFAKKTNTLEISVDVLYQAKAANEVK